ncbi:hypothetical protein Tco_0182512, partial [Tanacetum coccineum]
FLDPGPFPSDKFADDWISDTPTVVVDKDLVTNRSEIVDVSLTRKVNAAIFCGG